MSADGRSEERISGLLTGWLMGQLMGGQAPEPLTIHNSPLAGDFSRHNSHKPVLALLVHSRPQNYESKNLETLRGMTAH